MDTYNILNEYKKAIIAKLKKLLTLIEKNDAVKSATLDDNGELHIIFTEPVDIEKQNVVNVFIHGGVIKKAASKDNIDDQYFKIPAIGAF